MSSDFSLADNQEANEVIICELIGRLRKELAFSTGANNMLRILSEQKKLDSKSTKRAFETRSQAEEKIDLIRLALKKYSLRSPTIDANGLQIATKDHEDNCSSMCAPFCTYENDGAYTSFRAPKPVSGELTINLIGCGDLISKVEGRDYGWTTFFGHSTIDPPSFFSSKYGRKLCSAKKWTQSAPSMKYRDSQNVSFASRPEVFALIKLDSHVVATTMAKPISSYCWDERFVFDLYQDREMEVEIYYKDARSMCAFCVFRLEDLDVFPLKATVDLEPQGVLRVDVNFKRYIPLHNIQKRRRIFHSQESPSSRVFSTCRRPTTPRRMLSKAGAFDGGGEMRSSLPIIGFFQRTFLNERHRRNNNVDSVVCSGDDTGGSAAGFVANDPVQRRPFSFFDRFASDPGKMAKSTCRQLNSLH